MYEEVVGLPLGEQQQQQKGDFNSFSKFLQ
jgi:hypothetical protein